MMRATVSENLSNVMILGISMADMMELNATRRVQWQTSRARIAIVTMKKDAVIEAVRCTTVTNLLDVSSKQYYQTNCMLMEGSYTAQGTPMSRPHRS